MEARWFWRFSAARANASTALRRATQAVLPNRRRRLTVRAVSAQRHRNGLMEMPMQDLRNCFAAALVMLTPSVLGAAALPVIADRAQGEVTRDQGAAIEGVAAGKAIEAGTRVRTGADGRVEFSFRGAPTLKLGSRADLLLHSTDKDVLRAKLLGGAMSVDTTAGKVGGTRDLRLNAGELRLRINGARAWVETAAQGSQVCLLSGAVDAQFKEQPARLDTPGQCLRTAGATSTWTMVPEALLAERLALTQAVTQEIAVMATPRPPPAAAPEIKVIEIKPAPVETPPPPAAQLEAEAPATAKPEAAEGVAVPPVAVLAPPVKAEPLLEPQVTPPPVVALPDPTIPAVSAAALSVPEAVAVLEIPALPEPAPAPAKPAAVAVESPPAPVKSEARPEPKPQPKAAPVAAAASPDPTAPALATVALSVPALVAVPEIPVLEIPLPPPASEPEPSVEAKPSATLRPEPVVEKPAAPPVAAEAPANAAAVVETPDAAAEPEPLTPATEAVKLAVGAPVAEPVLAAEAEAPPSPTNPEVAAIAPAAPAEEAPVDDGRRWSVVLASFPLKETADTEVARLKTLGLSAAEAREYRVGERHGFRVGMGRYNTREEADAALNKLLGRDPELVGWLAKY